MTVRFKTGVADNEFRISYEVESDIPQPDEEAEQPKEDNQETLLKMCVDTLNREIEICKKRMETEPDQKTWLHGVSDGLINARFFINQVFYDWRNSVQSSKEDVQEQGISDEEIKVMAEEYADNYANLEWPQSISETFIAGAKAIVNLRDKQKDKIRMAIDECERHITKFADNALGRLKSLNEIGKETAFLHMKQFLESIKDK